jgi:hypothetical protein
MLQPVIWIEPGLAWNYSPIRITQQRSPPWRSKGWPLVFR